MSKGSNKETKVFSQVSETQYPYVVVRYMNAVYGRMSVRFILPGGIIEKGILCVEFKDPFENGFLREEAQQAAVKKLLSEVIRTKFRMCLVISRSEAIYCEPEGTTNKEVPPSGGIGIGLMQVTEEITKH